MMNLAYDSVLTHIILRLFKFSKAVEGISSILLSSRSLKKEKYNFICVILGRYEMGMKNEWWKTVISISSC